MQRGSDWACFTQQARFQRQRARASADDPTALACLRMAEMFEDLAVRARHLRDRS